mgnify:CR=1 FL=1
MDVVREALGEAQSRLAELESRYRAELISELGKVTADTAAHPSATRTAAREAARSASGRVAVARAAAPFSIQPPKHQASTAFWAWRRFSASSHTRERAPSMTASVTSSPRCAGRQCRKTASGEARPISASST